MIDRATNKVVGGDRFGLDQRPSPDHFAGRPAALHRERGGRHGLGDRPAQTPAPRQDQDAAPVAGIAISADGGTVVAVDDAEPKLVLIDTRAARPREVRARGRAEGRADRPLRARQQRDRRHQLEQQHGEPDRPGVPPADRYQGRPSADGHGFHGDELFVACQGDGSVHVIDVPGQKWKTQASRPAGAAS